jgi:aspartyl-tRNA(Asn)/glutamyl-tRNA(Gln) amidotransferase subunit A
MDTTTSLTSLSVRQILDGFAKREFSSTDLVQAQLNAISHDSSLNAFLTVCNESALADATSKDQERAAGSKLPLLGVPIAIKDSIVTKGIRTTCASKMLANFVPPYDACVIERLRAAGAVVLGKTNLDEFCMGSSTENSAFGPTKNPWDRSRVAGGTSGGSAAAVAAGQAPLALGSDTGGSIRQPASFCGVVGLKPTYGRVSRFGLVAYASSLDQIGPLARNVEDCALLAQIISGKDARDATSSHALVPDWSAQLSKPIKGMRIGIPKEYFVGSLQPEVAEAVRAALQQLESLGAIAVEVSLPHTQYSLPTYYIIAMAEASSNLARFDGVRYGHRCSQPEDLEDLYCRSRTEGFGEEVKRRIMLGSHVLSSGYYDAYYLKAQKVRALIRQDFTQAFAQKCDLLLCPVAPSTAFKIGEKVSDPMSMYLSDIFTITVNLAGLPALSVPCGFDRQGLPISFQLIGPDWQEERLLQVGYQYQQAKNWPTLAAQQKPIV